MSSVDDDKAASCARGKRPFLQAQETAEKSIANDNDDNKKKRTNITMNRIFPDPSLLNTLFQFLDWEDKLSCSLVSKLWKQEISHVPHISHKTSAVRSWLNALECSMEEEWRMNQRKVAVALLTKEFYERAAEEDIRNGGNLTRGKCLEIGISEIISNRAISICGDSADYYCLSSLASELKIDKASNATQASYHLLYNDSVSGSGGYSLYAFRYYCLQNQVCQVQPWNTYSIEQMFKEDDVDGPLQGPHSIDEMFKEDEFVGPLRGPFTLTSLELILKGIKKILHTEPPDNEPEFDDFADPIPTTSSIAEWVQNVGLGLNSSNGGKAISVMIGRKGGDPNIWVYKSCTIYQKNRNSLICCFTCTGDPIHFQSYQAAAEFLLCNSQDWRSHDKYGMLAFPFEYLYPEFYENPADYWPQHEQFGLLNGPWTTARVIDVLKQLWRLIHDNELETWEPSTGSARQLLRRFKIG